MNGLPIRDNVLKMTPYSPGKPVEEVKRELGLSHVIKLASNENPHGPSKRAIEAIVEAAKDLHIYPDGGALLLRNAISEKFGIPANQVQVGNGSDELIHTLGQVFLSGPEDEVIVGYPSFVRYDAAAQLASSQLIRVPLDADYKHDLNAMAEAVTANTKIIFIANPNNPTGTIVSKQEFDAFLESVPNNVCVVLDEAYFEFAAGDPNYPVSLDYIRAGRNVVGLRTFSKAFGLAGIRIGFGFMPAEVSDAFDRAREPFNVNSLAQVAAVAALEDDAHVQKTVETNAAGLEMLNEAFREIGAKPVQSYANFVFADLGRPARPVFQALLELGIITRSGDVLGAPNCLRVSIGTPDEMNLFVTALKQVSAASV